MVNCNVLNILLVGKELTFRIENRKDFILIPSVLNMVMKIA